MLKYNPQLKTKARTLRITLTDAEQRLWERLRRKQILGVQFCACGTVGSGRRWLPSSLRSCTSQTRLATQHILGAAAFDGSTFRRPPGATTTGKLSPKKFFKWSKTEFFLD